MAVDAATAARIEDLYHFAGLADAEGEPDEAARYLGELYVLTNDDVQYAADQRDLAADRNAACRAFLATLLS